jgi:two-component system response regulator LytT
MRNSFFVRADGKFHRLELEEIEYIEAKKNYVRIVTDKTSYFTHITLRQIEEQLPHNLFCKIHRSFIIALNKIVYFDHELVQLRKEKIHVSGAFYEQLKNKVVIISEERNRKDGCSDNILDFDTNIKAS